ncbi:MULTISPECIES: class I SAM-dependent methyltransferase [unclassified Nostoc]|uniref:class I SAM-dependent methyltransferase n=1 Tax=unclassified Nostoc TaxID=2593658 RepID=UPI0025AAA7C1|nr:MULTISPECIES: class I SAM-dependent methyltransferase [unclassified Nostoc]MDM9582708.1 class I SAM-dependent methyltransferase [Nostoc sp. GT001]MDZ7944081.1 class I SAM-dependent methyltransferase [Nostoc sp. EfeVER01]MDZ7991982.1 class I SAM-dependent methyltransferase [Nostoc sp. EspVER01]
MDSNALLCAVIANHITTNPQQRITFAQFMDLALYHPEYGYYSSDALKIGFKGGDFFTSPNLCADFGELLAEQFFQMWEILGKPVTFSLVEMGAGQGLLALHILKYHQQHSPDFFTALEYIIVEKSPTLRQEQQQRLQDLPVRWCNLEEIPPNAIAGCFFSNELVDAFPVHQFILETGELREIYVTTDSNEKEICSSFVEVTGEPSTPQLAEYLDLVEMNFTQSAYPDGYRSEINLAALNWLSIVADRLQRGYVLTIDYGYPASRYYNPRRSQGTLQCYYQHRFHDNPYINIGRQDITAHVDFTVLERWGEKCNLKNVGFIQQGLFLMALGLGDRIAALSEQKEPLSQLLQHRNALHQLLDPTGLGGFGVLIQGKNLDNTEISQPLKGLILPE